MWKVQYHPEKSKSNEISLPPHSDKCILPEYILEDIVKKYDNDSSSLPHPLIFKLSTFTSSCFVGVKEFQQDLAVPLDIQNKLGLNKDMEVHLELTEVINDPDASIKIAPLTSHDVINDEQWKSILEAKLAQYYTVVSTGDVIHLPVASKDYVLDVVKVKGRSVCVVDKDIELIIENKIDNADRVDLSDDIEMGSDEWKYVYDVNEISNESIHRGVHLDKGIKVKFDVKLGEMITSDGGEFVIGDQYDQFEWNSVSVVPNEKDQKCWTNEFHDREVVIYSLMEQKIKVTTGLANGESLAVPEGQFKCSYCGNFISLNSKVMHESFCQRNNVRCNLGCDKTFFKQIPDSHWHCCDSLWGSSFESFKIHQFYLHEPSRCDKCDSQFGNRLELGIHKGTQCILADHICRYCHLNLPRGEQSYEARYHNMSQHEWECGSKTVSCHICNKNVRMRDLKTHLDLHEAKKNDQLEPQVCSNELCIRLANGDNILGLCGVCFGPLFSSMNDPDGKILQNKLKRRYILMIKNGGCKNVNDCSNDLCKSSPQFKLGHLKSMMDIVQYVEAEIIPKNIMRFCVDESTIIRSRILPIIEDKWSYGWKCKAIDVNGVDLNKIDTWLQTNAPTTTTVF